MSSKILPGEESAANQTPESISQTLAVAACYTDPTPDPVETGRRGQSRCPTDQSAPPKGLRKTSRPTASGRISVCDHSPLFLPVAVNESSPTWTSDIVHEPKIQRVQNIVVARPGTPVSRSTHGGRMSAAQSSYPKYTCSSHHTHQVCATSVASERKGSVVPGLPGEVVDIAFQGTTACASSGYHTQLMMEAQDLGCSSIVSPAEILKPAIPLNIHRQHPGTRWRCDEMHRSYICRDVDRTRPISHSTLPKRTAHIPHTWSQRRHPRITFSNGNGDVKPDHPSGPGTYGHVV
ncbi:hypothetical protein GJ744_008259 [Endocarpon pusillum]|uniref:Uncharacterized protein n=1 Tax=Endocarpon pusillum TaxID=364733 RepID=A0A8H7E3I1_9EURO|nr:hypothetical protein GJ744_008259 [Endocarpon pusillum]